MICKHMSCMYITTIRRALILSIFTFSTYFSQKNMILLFHSSSFENYILRISRRMRLKQRNNRQINACDSRLSTVHEISIFSVIEWTIIEREWNRPRNFNSLDNCR